MVKVLKALYALIVAAVVLQTFAVPDAEKFLNPRLGRIVFYHLPCALTATLLLLVSAYYALRYLSTKRWEYEIKSAAANELALVLILLTLGTGVIFSKAQWGSWWQWDPRQTSFLIVLLISTVYSVLRTRIESPERRAVLSARYCAATVILNLFLIFIVPRLPAVQNNSFHPSQAIISGMFDRVYSITLLEMLAVILVLSGWVYRIAVRAALLEYALDISSANMDDQGVVHYWSNSSHLLSTDADTKDEQTREPVGR